jgi:hypothetical protein
MNESGASLFSGGRVSSQRVPFTTSVNREVWFKFRDLCHSHGIPIEKAVEVLLRETLEKNGIEVREGMQDSKVQEPEMMRS